MRANTMGLVMLVLCAAGPAHAAPVQLARDRGSELVIYHDPAAPSSVAMAAAELQEYVHEVSGAKLAIVRRPVWPMICLGENAVSRAAGLSAESIPLEGFRIVTREASIYILGRDTAHGERTPGGGASTGTRNGTYAFIERFLGVRWLMPGEDLSGYFSLAPDEALSVVCEP